MKKTMWKWKAVLTLLVCMIAVGGSWSGCKVQAEEDTKEYTDITGFKYKIEYGILGNEMVASGIIITGYVGTKTELTIPEKMTTTAGTDLPVSTIGDSAFSDCDVLTSITIPDTVLFICPSAFSGCVGLTSIEIPASVTYIGNLVFDDCDNLNEIKVDPDNSNYTSQDKKGNECNAIMSNEGTELLYGCAETKIPDGVMRIEDYAFYGCHGLTEIEIPNTVTSIGEWAFYGCYGLTSITGMESVESIGDGAFCYSGLTKIEIPNTVTSIGNYAFDDCSKLTGITIPNTVESIGYCAFSYSGLTSISFEENSRLTSIGERTFSGCSKLTSINIPASVTDIGIWVFDNCESLIKIKVDPNNVNYTSQDLSGTECNAIMDKNRTTLLYGCSETKSILSTVKTIGDSAFYGCSGLTNITIPNTVTKIEAYAFNGSGLTSIDIPASVTNIGDFAFADCDKLTSITGMEGVENIGDDVFEDCSENLVIQTSANSPACKYAWEAGITVVDMSGNPLAPPSGTGTQTPTILGGTQGTTPTTVAPIQTSVLAAKGTVLVAADVKAEVRVTSGDAANPTAEYLKSTDKSAKKITVPNAVTVNGITYQVTSVAAKAFAKNKKLTSITIGKNVTSIGKDAFKNCSALKSVTIQSSGLTKIGAGAFSGDKKLVKMTLKSMKLTKKSIGKNALKGTNKKLKIKVPKNQVTKYKAYFKGKGNKSVKVTK